MEAEREVERERERVGEKEEGGRREVEREVERERVGEKEEGVCFGEILVFFFGWGLS